MSTPQPPLAYTDAEVSSLLRVSKRTVYRLRKSGALGAVRIGRAVRTPADALAEFLERARLNGEHGGHVPSKRSDCEVRDEQNRADR